MRHRITIERNDGTADGGGGVADSWSTVATVWAQIEDFSASASSHAGRAVTRDGLQAIIRHRSDVSAGMQLTHDGNIYRIRSVADREQTARFLALTCERVAGT